jgi:hypothetical protein
VEDPWQILRDGGLPLAAPRTSTRRTASELAHAVAAAVAQRPHSREADALGAYILAWQAHWPTSFIRELGGQAEPLVGWARATVRDANRLLKLRRIAIENLSTVL